MPETTVEGHRGAWTLRNSSSAAIRPAQISSIRSQGTQCVGSPRRPSIRNPSSGRRPDGPSAPGSAPETGRSARPRPRSPASYSPSSSWRTSVSSSGWGQVPGARASHCTASVGCIPVTRQTRSRSSWGSSIASKITRRYRAGVVGMIGADSRAAGSRMRNRRSTTAPAVRLPRPRTVLLLLALAGPGRFGIANSSPTWTEKPGRTSPPSSRIEAVSRVKWSGAV